MPLIESPTFKATSDKVMEIPQPAISGLNLKDLEYEQDVGQSPYMLNMMYRNGAFSKRYGQKVYKVEDDTIYNMIMYRGCLVKHIGTKVYNNDTVIATGLEERKGLFITFNQRLYYLNNNIYTCYFDTDEYKSLEEKPSDWSTSWKNYYKFKNGGYVHLDDASAPTFVKYKYFKANENYNKLVWEKVEPYVPIIVINRKPDGTGGDTSEAYNMVGTGFQNNFHGDDSSVDFYLTDKDLDEVVPKVTIDNVEWTYDASLSSANTFKVDYEAGKITLKSAAPNGTNNVEIIAYKHDDEWTDYNKQILNSTCYSCFGGNNNSRLFVAGGGKSMYFYTEVYDASYFPYTNYAKVGNSYDDIVGFGQQYNVLLIFKPTEIYSLTYYQASSDDTTSERQIGVGMFSSQVVNSSMGCDCPNTIQLINNQLTWFSSRVGVCTLVSTNIVDERNVRTISRNIDNTNNFDVKGILNIDLNENETPIYDTVQSADYDNKYFLVFPKEYKKSGESYELVDCGLAYVWDYLISPYTVTSSKVTNPSELAWYLFDHFYTKQFLRINEKLVYSTDITNFKTSIIELNESFDDLDFDNDGKADAIDSYYMTPFLQFGAVEYLKTIKNLYIQCRGDTASVIDVFYYTDESSEPEQDSESIRIGGRIWQKFSWDTFEWFITNWANTFRRKCSLKKVQMAAFFFRNNEPSRDMSITHISLQYQIIKFIK